MEFTHDIYFYMGRDRRVTNIYLFRSLFSIRTTIRNHDKLYHDQIRFVTVRYDFGLLEFGSQILWATKRLHAHQS